MALDASLLSQLVTDLTQPAQLFCLLLILSLTVNLEFGYAGIPNFGKVLFVAVGAFVAGSLSYRLMIYLLGLKGADIFAFQATFVPQIDAHLANHPLTAIGLAFFMLAIGAVLGGLVGFLSSYPAIRLREDYLGMLLLASGEFFNYASQAYYPFLGGAQGMTSPSPIFSLAAFTGEQNLAVLGVLAAFALAVYVYAEKVGRSPLGRTLRAVRDSEVASEALGKDNVAIRRNVLIVGSMLAGMVGVLWLFYQPYIEPGTIGSFTRQTFTFIPFVIVILGGVSNNRGVLLGTFVYLVIIESFSQGTTYILSQGYSLPVDLSRVQAVLIGALLIFVMLRRPQGLVPEKPTLTIKRSKLKEMVDNLMRGGSSDLAEVEKEAKAE
ncbi:MAG: branched-chain amino acid ABC transporter permease [Thaumarchaeota archaeon]|nr:branched-chain amino acid ABC transporter permease [Nitrososphaerota archaeon]